MLDCTRRLRHKDTPFYRTNLPHLSGVLRIAREGGNGLPIVANSLAAQDFPFQFAGGQCMYSPSPHGSCRTFPRSHSQQESGLNSEHI